MLIAIHHSDLTRISNLLTTGFDVQSSITPDKRNIIELAVEKGYIPTLDLFKKFGADLKVVDATGRTYLHY